VSLWNWPEKRYATRLARRLLAALTRVREAHPTLTAKEQYAKALMQALDCDAERAAELISDAEDSVSWWPHDKELNFRDLVHFVAVTLYMAECGAQRAGTTVVFRDIIYKRIPERL
jgi:hypothetical protein